MRGGQGLLSSLLPAGVGGADILDDSQHIRLRAQEAVLVGTSGEKRRRDFALGRHCAHLALEIIGVTAPTIPSTPEGAPLWPEGVNGSITHTAGYAAAIAAPCTLFRGLGLDAEQIGGVTEGLFPKLFGVEEQEWLMHMAAETRAQAATILFSAKEAHWKAAGRNMPLRFRDLAVLVEGAEVLIRGSDGTQTAGRCIVARNMAIVLVGLVA